MKFSDLLKFFLLPLYRPLCGLRALLENKRMLIYSVIIFLFLGIIYTISVQLALSRGLGAVVEPFLKIPAKDYYFWQRFWQIPFFFLTSILFAGTVRLLAEFAGGKGSFIQLFSIFAAAQTLPMFLTMWLPETFEFVFFPGGDIYPLWFTIGRQVLGILWPLAITVIGICLAEKIHWLLSILFTLIAAIPMTALMVIFIR